MKRAWIFLVLGPAAAATAWLICVVASKGPWSFAAISALIMFIFTFFVAAIAALVDGCLARAPAYLRALPAAIIGAAAPAGVIFAFSGCVLPVSIWMPFAIGGALCMGTCSLLSNDDGGWRRFALPARG